MPRIAFFFGMSSRVESPWPRVVQVQPLPGQRLQVCMDDGRRLELDLHSLIQRRVAYWRLRQDRYFRQVSLDPLGGICWPEGEDLAPDGLERYSTKEALAWLNVAIKKSASSPAPAPRDLQADELVSL